MSFYKIEESWEALRSDLIKHPGTAIIIGATDSGKSTLARYLLKEMLSEEMPVCFIDADVGQSSLGLPGTVSMKLFGDLHGLDEFGFEQMSFVGSVNPAKRISPIIEATKRMSDVCRERVGAALLDTSGLISGEAGKALKLGKIRAVDPRHIIAVQRDNELEHILDLIVDRGIHRIRTSRAARVRSTDARVRYRRGRFTQYFENSGVTDFLVYSSDVKFFYNGKPVSLRDAAISGSGILIGLNHEEETVALGLVRDITGKSVTFGSPIQSLGKINRVIFGDIRI